MVRPALRAFALDPDGYRVRIFEIMPPVFFGLLPVFAVIVAVFFRGRPLPTHLTFATHLHAFIFVGLTVIEAARFARTPAVTAAAGAFVSAAIVVYMPVALREVFGGSWGATLAKAIGIAVIYMLVSISTFFLILTLAAA